MTVEGIRPSPALFARLATAGLSFGAARITLDGESLALRGTPTVALSGVEVSLPPGAFLQASRESEAMLAGLVKEGVGRAKQIADLFAGIGMFTFALAASAEIDAFEETEEAIAALAGAARATPRLKPVRTHSRDLFRVPLTTRELARYDAVVLDPPRAGAKAQAEALAASKVPKVDAIRELARGTCAFSSMAATASRAWSPWINSCSRRISRWWPSWKSRATLQLASPRRKPGSSFIRRCARWIPACAGMTSTGLASSH